ncbi:MAG: hypothetical protein ACRDXX_03175 [Stackebrandtia sp.]
MTDRQQNYPDSTGSRRDVNRPVFYNRTVAIDQREGQTHAGATYGTAASQPVEPATATVRPVERAPASAPPNAHMGGADPELAVAAGMQPRGPEVPQYPTAPPRQVPMQQSYPQHAQPQQSAGLDDLLHSASAPPAQQYAPPPQQQQQPVEAMYEPTQMHNPVASPQVAEPEQHDPRLGRNYPEQVGDGVYRRSRPGLGIAVALGALVMAGLIGFMLYKDVTSEAPASPSAMISAAFALAGLPLAAFGLYPLLGSGTKSGPENFGAVLRAPYIYLATGLILFVAAGLAA